MQMPIITQPPETLPHRLGKWCPSSFGGGTATRLVLADRFFAWSPLSKTGVIVSDATFLDVTIELKFDPVI